MKPLITFEHQGTTILNPYLSECGRFAVDPSHYGFELESTGGGFTALIKPLPDGGSVWLTGPFGDYAPDSQDDLIMVGLFNADGEQVDVHWLPSIEEVFELGEGREDEVIARLREDF